MSVAKQEIDTEYTEFPVCPHCGHVHKDWWDGAPAGEEDWDTTCESCSLDFRIVAHRDIKFSTKKDD